MQLRMVLAIIITRSPTTEEKNLSAKFNDTILFDDSTQITALTLYLETSIVPRLRLSHL